MRIIASNTTLCSDTLAIGRVGPFDMSFNGSPVFDSVQLFRAAQAVLFGRGDGPVEFEFSVRALFSTHAKALQFCALHRDTLPVQSTLQVVDDDEGINLVLAGAVRQVSFGSITGCAVVVRYKFTGAQFTSEDLPEDLEEDTDRMKVGKETPAADVEEITVTFASVFAGEPRYVNMNIERPSGQPPVMVTGYRDVTAAGFVAILSFPLPATGYFGRWQAVL